jgi:putative transcriptional regulator
VRPIGRRCATSCTAQSSIDRSVKHLIALVLLLPALAWAGVEDGEQAVLLVAHPRLDGSDFGRTVVLVAFPQDAGPTGVVLNRPLGITLGALFDEQPEIAKREDMVFYGGPVQPDGMLFVFRAAEHPVKALPVIDDIYLSADGRLFDALMAKTEEASAQRFFVGYAGWAEGQLDGEVARGDWFVLPAEANVIYEMPVETMWETLLLRATAETAGIRFHSTSGIASRAR